MMTPDFERATISAYETLKKYRVSSAPIVPLPILKTMRGVIVLSYAEMAETLGIDRQTTITMFGSENQDAVTNLKRDDGKLQYIVGYNQQLPFILLQRALARQLGHIVLQHDGSRTEEVRTQEAACFAYHFLCPRPLIQAVLVSGVSMTVEVLGNMTGCFERCLSGMRKIPGVRVPAEINQAIKSQFADYVNNFVSYQKSLKTGDNSAIADFGTFMDGYEE